MLALLDWFQAMGVDAALDEVPQDWLARGPCRPGAGFAWPRPRRGVQSQPAASRRRSDRAVRLSCAPVARLPDKPLQTEPAATRPRATTPLGPSDAETGARRIAREATSLEALESALRNFDGCGLKTTATKLCFYRGAPQAPTDDHRRGAGPGRRS